MLRQRYLATLACSLTIPCYFSLFTDMLHVDFATKSLPRDSKSSNPMDYAGFDSLLGSFELMMSRESPPLGGDPLMLLSDLQWRMDVLNALDLSGRTKDTGARLHADREEQRHEVMRVR